MSARSFLASAVLLLLLALPRPARACWDGFGAEVGNVSVLQAGDSEWHAEKARELATWLPRIDALLPTGTRLDVEHGSVSLHATSGGAPIAEARWKGGHLSSLFAAVLRIAPGARARVKNGHAVTPFTVQVLAVSDRRRAEDFSKALNDRNLVDSLIDSPGFYSAGGFPAMHPIAHVLEPSASDADHGNLTRVVVGAYLDAPAAAAAAASLRSHGIAAFVRAL